MNILVFTWDYPDKNRSTFTFVKQLVDEFARQGNDCCVISPYSITANRRFYKFKEILAFPEGGTVTILRPNFPSLSNWKIGSIELTELFRKFAIRYATRHLPFKPDVVYGHFWQCGYEGYCYAKQRNIPVFLATGEDHITFGENMPKKILHGFKEYISGVICVSTQKKNESIRKGLIDESKCYVAPNGYNHQLFHPTDRLSLRRKYNIDENAFIVSFVGTFMNRKGVNRLSEAIQTINNPNIESFFIGGKGEGEYIRPTCSGILYEGRLPHDKIPEYLNMSNVFVLPTLSEGCSNAVVEAVGCGLPIISSNLDFNLDVLDNSNAILINPSNISEIADAIRFLYDNPKQREILSKGSLKKAVDLTVEKRAANILHFIESKLITK